MKYWDLCQHFINFRSDILIIEIFHRQIHVLSFFFLIENLKTEKKHMKITNNLHSRTLILWGLYGVLLLQHSRFHFGHRFSLHIDESNYSTLELEVWSLRKWVIDQHCPPENTNRRWQQNSLVKNVLRHLKVKYNYGLTKPCWPPLSIGSITEYFHFQTRGPKLVS